MNFIMAFLLKQNYILIAVVRRLHPTVLEIEYRKHIVRWLDGAKDREGGRKKRAKSCNSAAEV